MTYPPGGPGYPPAQPQAPYTTPPTQQFGAAAPEPTPPGPSKLPLYLTATVAALGLAIYLASFGPVFDAGGSLLELIAAPVVAGILAGVSLLPKQDDRSAIAAVFAVLGFLLLIYVVIAAGPSIGWAFYLFIVFSVLQTIAAVAKVLLDAGVITAPTPKPKYEQQPYGPYGGQAPYGYGQPGPQYGAPGPQQGYGAPGAPQQFGGGGFPGAPSTGGFPALGQRGPGGPAGAPAAAPGGYGPQSGPPTPPTGFPAFGQPQAAAVPSASSQPTQQFDVPQQAPQQSVPPPS